MAKTYYTQDHEWLTVDGGVATITTPSPALRATSPPARGRGTQAG
jgi:glycine cleavage system H lipoate-binding protein